MFSCSTFLFLGITAWQRVSLQNPQKAHEKNCCISFGKTGWQRKEKKNVLECVTAWLYWDMEMSESFGCTDGCHHSNWTRNLFGDRVCCPQRLATRCEDRGAAQHWERVSGKSRGFFLRNNGISQRLAACSEEGQWDDCLDHPQSQARGTGAWPGGAQPWVRLCDSSNL